jgi:hypothetical protein
MRFALLLLLGAFLARAGFLLSPNDRRHRRLSFFFVQKMQSGQ